MIFRIFNFATILLILFASTYGYGKSDRYTKASKAIKGYGTKTYGTEPSSGYGSTKTLIPSRNIHGRQEARYGGLKPITYEENGLRNRYTALGFRDSVVSFNRDSVESFNRDSVESFGSRDSVESFNFGKFDKFRNFDNFGSFGNFHSGSDEFDGYGNLGGFQKKFFQKPEKFPSLERNVLKITESLKSSDESLENLFDITLYTNGDRSTSLADVFNVLESSHESFDGNGRFTTKLDSRILSKNSRNCKDCRLPDISLVKVRPNNEFHITSNQADTSQKQASLVKVLPISFNLPEITQIKKDSIATPLFNSNQPEITPVMQKSLPNPILIDPNLTETIPENKIPVNAVVGPSTRNSLAENRDEMSLEKIRTFPTNPVDKETRIIELKNTRVSSLASNLETNTANLERTPNINILGLSPILNAILSTNQQINEGFLRDTGIDDSSGNEISLEFRDYSLESTEEEEDVTAKMVTGEKIGKLILSDESVANVNDMIADSTTITSDGWNLLRALQSLVVVNFE